MKHDNDHYTAYSDYAKTLRTWLVAYGIGGPVLLVTQERLATRVIASGCARWIVCIFLAAVAIQVILAFVNKWITWIQYGDAASFGRPPRFRVYTIEDLWSGVEPALDVVSIVAFGGATLWALIICTAETPASPPAEPPPDCPVVRVVDGDTLVVRYRPAEAVEERVRLLDIKAPDRGEPGFAEATADLTRLVGEKKRVRLEFDGDRTRRDAFGRLLCYVRDADGRLLNVELVKSGVAEYWTKYGKGKYAEQFGNFSDRQTKGD